MLLIIMTASNFLSTSFSLKINLFLFIYAHLWAKYVEFTQFSKCLKFCLKPFLFKKLLMWMCIFTSYLQSNNMQTKIYLVIQETHVWSGVILTFLTVGGIKELSSFCSKEIQISGTKESKVFWNNVSREK